MINELSILIPTFNDDCFQQVEELQHSAVQIDGLRFEILVSDDASTNPDVVRSNAKINTLEHCRLLRHNVNLGRAANRNFLVREAQYDWLLFLDCNVKIHPESFILNYLQSEPADLVIGSVGVDEDPDLSVHNLRYMYEKKIQPKHDATHRQKHPYQSFRTTNFMARHSVMLDNPFDETLKGYGYEDVLFGKRLSEKGMSIRHIDNTVIMTHFEPNEKYVAKIEEAMRTLYGLRDKLTDYSPLLLTANRLRKWHLSQVFLFCYQKQYERVRKNLTGETPSIKWLNLYKLGYFLSLYPRRS